MQRTNCQQPTIPSPLQSDLPLMLWGAPHSASLPLFVAALCSTMCHFCPDASKYDFNFEAEDVEMYAPASVRQIIAKSFLRPPSAAHSACRGQWGASEMCSSNTGSSTPLVVATAETITI